MSHLLYMQKLDAQLQWLAMQPPLHSALGQLADVGIVQDLSMEFLGHRQAPPATLLSVMLALLGLVLFILLVIPKARLSLWSLWYFVASSDKKPRKPDDLKLEKHSASTRRMKIVFIRHGESEWNAVFNNGWKIFLPFRLVRALINEGLMLFRRDSLFFDSPLNDVGLKQGWELLTFLASQPTGCRQPGTAQRPVEELEPEDVVSIIRGDAGESVIVSSLLRRAISTGLISLSPRLLKSSVSDRVMLMTSLQEISRNVDTLALTPAKALPICPQNEAAMKGMGDLMTHFYGTRLDKKYNAGNKTISMRANKRQEQFVKWVFEQKEVDCIIVCGHSLWFREFFKSYMPKASSHVAGTAKVVNCGVIAFDLYQNGKVTRIPPESIKEIYGGFEVKGKKHKKA
ncbi:unnamed protein product [Polarella glacialis]|uniref:Uncharacterized protein n=1 Tax=Polarella glacialis TaxID=89957 RepID=A0A813D882_POLGL|nr:unnamed protein product [Polarella glacialis]